MKLEGKVAIVTGGGQGIGEGIVRCLAEEGADIAIFDINGDNARRIAAELEGAGRKMLAVEGDATEAGPVSAAVEATLAHFGRIDILVNNVGGNKGAPLDRTEPANITNRTEGEWQGSYEINLKSHILMTQAVAPHLLGQRSGKIINVASDAAKLPTTGATMPYSTFKAADVAFTRNVATELAGANINVNCILPGLIYTPLWESGATAFHAMQLAAARASEDKRAGNFSLEELENMTPREWWLKSTVQQSTPMQREQTPEDIGKAVAFLVSEDAKNITGQVLSVDGGLVMH